MGDGPTVVNSGGNGATAVAIVIALAALVVLLFATGVIDLSGKPMGTWGHIKKDFALQLGHGVFEVEDGQFLAP